jgi:Na+-transporting NADH:ubiquinone oxidoreductase subunit NqrA
VQETETEVTTGKMVNTKLWTALGNTPFDAVKVIGNEPLSIGVPPRMPAANVTPVGSAPNSVMVGTGVPVAVTINEPTVPTVNVVLLALVIAGAT